MFNFLKHLFVRSKEQPPVVPSSTMQHKEKDSSFECHPALDVISSSPHSQPYVIIDTETTGLNPEVDQIIQLSALRFTKEGKPDGSFDTYLNPGRRIPARASQINGITDRMVASAPTAEQVREDFIAFTSGHLIIGYNIVFDLKFLCHTFGDTFRRRDYLDVLSLAREYLNTPNFKLETVSSSIGFRPKRGFHRSLSDCEATAAVLEQIIRIAGPVDPFIRNFYGGLTDTEKKIQSEWHQWLTLSQPLYLQGEEARKEGRLEDALRFFAQAKEASGVVYPFLYESYAMTYRKQRDYQSEIAILDEGITRLGKENCPSLIERRGKAVKKLEIAQVAERQAEEKALKRAERAERKLRKLEESQSKPKRQQTRPILKLDDAGTILEEFPSISAAAHSVGVTTKGIRDAANGKQKHAGGFCWKYKSIEADGIQSSRM